MAACPDKLLHCCADRNSCNREMQIGAKTLSDKLKSASLQGFIETISHCCCCLTGMGEPFVVCTGLGDHDGHQPREGPS